MITPAPDDADPLPRADVPCVNRMAPLLSVPYVRTLPPKEPLANCRLCKARVVVLEDEKTLVPHRIREDKKEPMCPDRGLYASDVAMWKARQEAAGKW